MGERRLKPTKTIFISSPSDTRQERLKALTIVLKLAREFSHYFSVEPVLWEREPLKATGHFQAGLKPHESDIVVVILWSRLGIPLSVETYPGPITGRQVTGTEWEFEDAFASYQVNQKPDLLLYRKNAPVMGCLENDAALEQQRQQKRALEDFIERWFIDKSTNGYKLAFREFATTTEFEDMLEIHLRELLDAQLDGEKKIDIHWHQGSPFRGLESFELEHAPVFFGRTRARNELRELLARRIDESCAFVLVFGASGCGKSSLVKSGLLADLELPGMIGHVALCRHAIYRPSDAPDDLVLGLAHALMSSAALPELLDLGFDSQTLFEQLIGTAGQVALPIHQALDAAKNKLPDLTERAEARLVLIIDQLEELFTIDGLTLQKRTAFVLTLERLARSGLVWVVATMRSDFFDRLEQLPKLVQISEDARYLLTFPDDAEIGQIIRQPALEAGVTFEYNKELGYGLDDELCKAAAKAPSALPLLEFTLDQLWRKRTEQGELTFAAYDALGGLEGALGCRAEEEFSKLPADVQAVLPQVLYALATVDQDSGTKITARSASFAALPESNPAARLVKAFLAPQSRLLVAEGDDKPGRVRVSHEALLTHWGRARVQLAYDRADLQLRSRLEQAASTWYATDIFKRADRLLTAGLPLTEAEDLLSRRQNELDITVIAYINASTTAVKAQMRGHRRRLYGIIAGVSLLAGIALISAFMFYRQKMQADLERKIALSGELAAQAALLADHAPDDFIIERAAALAIESWNFVHNSEASTIANKLLRMLPKYRIEHGDTVMSIAFSPDGSLLATGSKDKMLRLFRVENSEELFRREQGDWVSSVAFSQNGRFLSTGSKDKTARLIDMANHEEVFRLVHDGEVRKVIFSPDSRLLATASADHRLRLLEVGTGQVLWQVMHDDEVMNIAFSADGRLLATGSKDRLARVIETATGRERVRISHGDAVIHVVFSPDGQFLATASKDKMARVINAATGQVALFIKHNDSVRSVAFSPDGRWIVAGSDDKTASVTDIRTGMEIARIFHKDGVFAVKFSPDGQLLATAGADNMAQIIDTQTWLELTHIMHGGPVWNIAFSPDSRLLATASSDHLARLIEPRVIQDVIQIDNNGPVYSIAFDPKGRLLASGSADKTARLVDLKTGAERAWIIHDDVVYSVAFSSNGRFFATASKDKTARLIDTATGKEKAKIFHDGEVRSIAFSPDSRWLATGSLDKSVKLIDTESGLEVRQYIHGDEIWSVVFSFDNQSLAIAGKDGAIILIDPQTGGNISSIKLLSPVSRVAFSPDGQLLATASEDGVARLFDTSTGKEKARFEHMEPVHHVAFSPNGRLLATGSEDKTVRLIEIDGNQEIARIKHGGAVTAMAFSPDGRFLATGSQDGTSRLIETDSGLEVARTYHKNMVFAVAFSADGQWLATGDWDGHVRLTDKEPQHIFDNLCKKAGRNLRQDELSDYLGISGPHPSCEGWRTPGMVNGRQ